MSTHKPNYSLTDRLLARRQQEWSALGGVTFVFQPAEEGKVRWPKRPWRAFFDGLLSLLCSDSCTFSSKSARLLLQAVSCFTRRLLTSLKLTPESCSKQPAPCHAQRSHAMPYSMSLCVYRFVALHLLFLEQCLPSTLGLSQGGASPTRQFCPVLFLCFVCVSYRVGLGHAASPRRGALWNIYTDAITSHYYYWLITY